MQTLLVFSHLRWNFVYQRPQHLLTRLASRWRVVVVEEPVTGQAGNRLEILQPAPGVEVWRPHVTGDAAGFHDDHLPALRQLLGQAVQQQRLKDLWLWFYTPMAVPLAAGLAARGIVYDCMDELTLFRHAPRQLVQRENMLLRQADLVFTGGPSLYRAKKDRHPAVHCFPSSVDAHHFRATAGDHPAQAGLARPRLGYCGVIDERLELRLIEALAIRHPGWQVVMVGPVAKIDPAALPRQPGIHWLGQRSYQELPALISGWDVCLMPFALNEATRYISPTKMLEYMACGRPSVSTAVRDVVEPYGHLVTIADGPQAFVAACEAVLGRSPQAQQAHAAALAAAIGLTSWDRTARRMADLIAAADAAKASAEATAPAASLAKVA